MRGAVALYGAELLAKCHFNQFIPSLDTSMHVKAQAGVREHNALSSFQRENHDTLSSFDDFWGDLLICVTAARCTIDCGSLYVTINLSCIFFAF
jgi:hypothetical protein